MPKQTTLFWSAIAQTVATQGKHIFGSPRDIVGWGWTIAELTEEAKRWGLVVDVVPAALTAHLEVWALRYPSPPSPPNQIIACPYDLFRYFDTKNLEDARRTLRKQTECGAWLAVDDNEVILGSIVEGSDAEVRADALSYPFTHSDLEHTIAWVEDRAGEFWQEANAR
jgi:hypothetical protein